MGKLLKIKKDHWEIMRLDVAGRAPLEACGLVAGLENCSTKVYPLTNELNSSVRFRIAPLEQFRVFTDIEQNGWELLAIYHSHPSGPDHPSATDLAEFAYPGTYSLIWYPQYNIWHCRAYMLLNNQFMEVAIQIN